MPNPTIVCNGKTVELLRETILEPTSCPFCGGKISRHVTKKGTGAVTYCDNPDCSKKSTGKIKSWVKKQNILGIGDSILVALVEQLEIGSSADLYTLTISELADLSVSGIRFGESRATELVDEINKTRKMPLNMFLGSLGAKHLGRRKCQIMMEKAPELASLEAWRSGILRDPEIAQKAGVPGTAEEIQDGIDSVSDVIDQLLANGVVIDDSQPAQHEEVEEAGMIFCITGKLLSGKVKKDYKEPLAANGHTLVDDLDKTVNILVQADPNSTSSKSVKAKKLGIKIISETELQEFIK